MYSFISKAYLLRRIKNNEIQNVPPCASNSFRLMPAVVYICMPDINTLDNVDVRMLQCSDYGPHPAIIMTMYI